MPSDVQAFSFRRGWLVLWQRRRLLVSGALLCGLTAGVFSLLQPRIYRATTYLLVSESNIVESKAPNAGHIYYEVLRSYETLLKNDSLIEKTVRHFQLDQPPYELTPDRFKRRRILRVELPKNTRLLEVSVEFPDARLAAEIANYFASSAAAFNEEMNVRDVQRTPEVYLREELDRARKAMEESGRLREEFNKAAGLEELRESVWNLLDEKSQSESELTRLNTSLARAVASRAGLAEELKRQPPKIELRRNLAENPVFREPLDTEGSPKQRSPAASSISDESVNSVYQQIQTRLVETDSEILGLRAAIQSLESATEAIRQKLARLLREKAVKESALERLTGEHERARQSYATLGERYREASVNVSARSTNLKLVAPAIVPDTPVRPRVLLNVLVALALGLVVSSLLAFCLNQLELSKAQARLDSGSEDKVKEIKRSAKGFS